MNFEDEPYARLYTRRTLTNKRLGWEGRAVMHEMLYEFDRAGVFEFEGDLADAIEMMSGLPTRAVRTGLQRLLTSKTWLVKGRFLVWPNFLDAQTCNRSDAARARDSRLRRKAMADATELLGHGVQAPQLTQRDDQSHPVTDAQTNEATGHTSSHVVTLSSALPSSTDPSSLPDAVAREDDAVDEPVEPETEPPPTELQSKAMAYLRNPTEGSCAYGPPETWPEVTAAFADFGAVFPGSGKLRSRDARAVVIVERFAEGITPQQLADTARGAKKDPHFAKNPSFQTVQTIWRDPGQIDRFCKLLASPVTLPGHRQPDSGTVRADEFR